MKSWNRVCNDLIRRERPKYWSNWTLIPTIDPGAYGIVDSATGDFTYIGLLDKPKVDNRSTSVQWALASTDVTQHQANVKISGNYVDPEDPEKKIDAGVEVTWGFKKEESLVSKFSVRSEKTLLDLNETIKGQWRTLAARAQEHGKGDGTNIHQGFCVVTSVMYADSGLNVGAESKESSFGITGTVTGIDGMNQGKGNGSWLYTTEQAGFSCHLWPSKPNQVASILQPIAYTVASFDGRAIIPDWTQVFENPRLNVNNKHGGTYIAHASLKYDTPEQKDCEKAESVSGGREVTITLPLDATNLRLTITFTHDDTQCSFHWDKPLLEWPTSERNIDIRGVAPHDPSCTERETQ